MHHPTDRIAHTTTFVTPVMEIAQWVINWNLKVQRKINMNINLYPEINNLYDF